MADEQGSGSAEAFDHALWGRGLRFVLVDHLRERNTMTVAEMVRVLADSGYQLRGRASKVISDALRWELARGRVVRLARGVYAYGRTPPTTARRIRLFAQRCQAWIVATTRGEEPPPTPATPPHRYQYVWLYPEDPSRPPWKRMGWLWST